MFTNIRQYEGKGKPDWIKEGGTVAVVNGYGYQQNVSFENIDKVTATQVVVGNSRYNIKRRLTRMGDSGAYSTTVFLADPDSKEVRFAVALKRKATAKYKVLRATEIFHKDDTEYNAEQIEKALDIWRKCAKAVEALSDPVKSVNPEA